MWQEKNAAAERKQNMRYRRYSASSLTDSLRSVVRLRRADGAHRQKTHAHNPEEERDNRKKATALPFFHRLRPPDKHHEI